MKGLVSFPPCRSCEPANASNHWSVWRERGEARVAAWSLVAGEVGRPEESPSSLGSMMEAAVGYGSRGNQPFCSGSQSHVAIFQFLALFEFTY